MSPSMTLQVKGMTCGHCARTVERAARGVRGVGAARVDLATGTLAIEVQEAWPGRPELSAAVERAGYAIEGSA